MQDELIEILTRQIEKKDIIIKTLIEANNELADTVEYYHNILYGCSK